jgi:hypothetical protein
LQVNWIDASNRLISSSGRIEPISGDWRSVRMVVEAPPDAATAMIFASPDVASSVWYDDFSFARTDEKTGKMSGTE